MKFIEFPELFTLSNALTYDSPECAIRTRIEAYSCKSINREKKMFKALEHSYAEDLAFNLSVSPPEEALASPFGPLDQPSARKVLYLLIATLNVAFPDHDFSEVRPDAFKKEESPAGVLNALSNTLLSLRPAPGSVSDYTPRSYSSYPPPLDVPSSPELSASFPSGRSKKIKDEVLTGTHPTFYRILDNIITLKDCDVYSYTPGNEWDPHAVDSDDEEDISSDEELDEGDWDAFDFEPDEGIATPTKPRPSKRLEETDLQYPRRRLGGLLWSANWFIHNKKQKRILFVSVWARKRIGGWMEPRRTEWSAASARSLGLGF
ncbi:Maf1 regulator [Calocera cornea HHB12733]|uniref:Repressor of RNA polymerase III transcription MAF1 n=1 Tax=Calocera cornea HHB12733 TaxID=1353952 RepID=A0A165DPI5_9BASI|nr:Maf1 regulator [Calocera cornea HHB12733]